MLTAPVQYRLTVGSVNDPAEADADRIAEVALERIANSPDAGIDAPTTSGRIRRSPSDDVDIGLREQTRSGRIRRSSANGAAAGGPVGEQTARNIESSRGSGRPLEEPLRRTMESGFSADFSGVRVHADGEADELNRDLQARAFATGSDIFFRSGEYQPSTSAGQTLIAHELAHTVQQGASVRRSTDDHVIRRAFEVQNTTWGEAASVSVTAPKEGLTGVFFVKNKSGKTLVVKAVKGGARGEMGSVIMGAAGAETVGHRSVLLKSPEGAALLKVLHSLASKYRKANKTKKGQNPVKLKIEMQLESGKNDSVMIMEGYDNLSNMESLQDRDDMKAVFDLMAVNGFYKGLGRIHAADMMMGNQDRLDARNAKNVFVNVWSGQTVGLDTDVNAHGFEQVTGDITPGAGEMRPVSPAEYRPSLEGHQYKDFVHYAIQGSQSTKEVTLKSGAQAQKPMGARRGTMDVPDFRLGGDPAKVAGIFDGFVDRLIEQAEIVAKGNEVWLKAHDWSKAKAEFIRGVDEGMASLRKNMGDITAKSDDLTSRLGDDAFLDPRVFKIRAMYTELINYGLTEKESYELLEMYAEHLVNGGTEDDFQTWVRRYYLAAAGKATKLPNMPTAPQRPSGKIRARGRGKAKAIV